MFKRALLLSCAFAAAILLAPTARADDPPALLTAGKLTYGTAASFSPFEFQKDGKLAGFDIEMAEALAAKMGLATAALNMEFKGLIPALQGRRVDLINSAMYINSQRAEQVEFIPYMTIGNEIVVRKGNPLGIKARGDLCGHRVAVTLGGIEETYARQDVEACKAAGKPEPDGADPADRAGQFAFVAAGPCRRALRRRTPSAVELMHERAGRVSRLQASRSRATPASAWRCARDDPAMKAALETALHGRRGRRQLCQAAGEVRPAAPAARCSDPGRPPVELVAPGLIVDYVFSSRFFDAALMTLAISVASLFFGMLVGLAARAAAGGAAGGLRWFAVGYLWLFRGTPVLFQLIFVFNVLPTFGIVLPGIDLRRARPGAERGGLHGRDHALRHPRRRPRAAPGRPGVGHAGPAGDALGRAAAGVAHRRPADRQPVHRHAEAVGPGLGDRGGGAAAGRQPDCLRRISATSRR